MSPRLLPLTLAMSLAWQAPALALGIGEWRPLSTLGEPFIAEAPLLHAPGESVEATCFHLLPAQEPGLPALLRGRFSLRESARGTLVRLESDSIIKDPVIRMAVRLECGANQTKVSEVLLSPRGLMPPAPVLPDVQAAPASAAPRAETARPARLDAPRSAPARVSAMRAAPAPRTPPATAPERGMKLALQLGLVAQTASVQARDDLRRAYRSLMELADAQAVLLRGAPPDSTPATPLPAPAQEPAPAATPDLAPAPAPAAVQPAASPTHAAPSPPAKALVSSRWLWPALGLVMLAFLIGMALAARRKAEYKAIAPKGDDSYFLDDVHTRALLPPEEETTAPHKESWLADTQPAAAAKPSLPDTTPTPSAAADQGQAEAAPPSEEARPSEDIAPSPAGEHDNLATPYQTVLEVANTMVAYGRVSAAAETLEDHIRANPDEAVQPWLRLLELLRHADLRDEFESYAGRMRKHFNVAPPGWDAQAWHAEPDLAAPPGDTPEPPSPEQEHAALERFPHLVERIVGQWGTQECRRKLDHLLRDTRHGTRQGLPLPVVDEILFLLEILQAQHTARANPAAGTHAASALQPPARPR